MPVAMIGARKPTCREIRRNFFVNTRSGQFRLARIPSGAQPVATSN
jgi:hypothetical protein